MSLAEEAAQLVKHRTLLPSDRAALSGSVVRGITSLFEMDMFEGGGIEPCPAHPGLDAFRSLMEECGGSAGPIPRAVCYWQKISSGWDHQSLFKFAQFRCQSLALSLQQLESLDSGEREFALVEGTSRLARFGRTDVAAGSNVSSDGECRRAADDAARVEGRNRSRLRRLERVQHRKFALLDPTNLESAFRRQ